MANFLDSLSSYLVGNYGLLGMDENSRQDIYGYSGGLLSSFLPTSTVTPTDQSPTRTSFLGGIFDGGKDSLGWQLGSLGLGLYGLLNQKNAQEQALEEARKQFAYSQNVNRANFTTQGTNFLNQGLFQLEGLTAFNPNAGAERANNLLAGANQLGNAANLIGANGTFDQQINAIDKYTQLRDR